MPTVLVTGFETFGPHGENPTEAAVALLPDVVGAARIVTAVLPVEYGRCAEVALRLIEEHAPDAVVLTGLAAGRAAVTPERVAINVRDTGGVAGVADNAGYAPRDGLIVEGGPDGVFATLPNRAIIEALSAVGIPAEISNSAGTYICNETLYAVLTSIREVGSPVRMAGLVHVPDRDILPLDDLVRAMVVTLETVVTALEDR